jgi:AraC family transcriptional regulator, transcriptional activator of pobA
MSRKLSKETVLTHDAFSTDYMLDINSAVPGFSVDCNTALTEQLLDLNYYRSDFFIISLALKGEAVLNVNLKEHKVTKNHLIVTAPYDIRRVVSYKSCTHSSITFTTDFLEKTGIPKNTSDLLDFFSTQYTSVWELEEGDALNVKMLMDQTWQRHECLQQHAYGQELLNLSVCTFIYEIAALSKKYGKVINNHLSRKENLSMNFINAVRRNFKKERSLQYYAAELAITAKHLTETVKEITGKSAGEVIDSFVIQEARMLLDDASLSIAEISDELNFSDQSFFGKFFKRHTGVSPKEYRNSFNNLP